MTIERFETLFNQVQEMFRTTDAFKKQQKGESFSPIYFDLLNTSYEKEGITGILKDIESYRIFCNLSLFVENSLDSFQNVNHYPFLEDNKLIFDIEDINGVENNIDLNLGYIYQKALIESDCNLSNYRFKLNDLGVSEECLENLYSLSNIILLGDNLSISSDNYFSLFTHKFYFELEGVELNVFVEKPSSNFLNEFILYYFRNVKTEYLKINICFDDSLNLKQIEKYLKNHLSILNSCDILITNNVENQIECCIKSNECLDLERLQQLFEDYYIIQGEQRKNECIKQVYQE